MVSTFGVAIHKVGPIHFMRISRASQYGSQNPLQMDELISQQDGIHFKARNRISDESEDHFEWSGLIEIQAVPNPLQLKW